MARAHATTNHDEIRNWIEQRGGHPSVVSATGEHGLLRVDFGKPEESLEEIDWDDFFDTFEEKQLAFLYQDKTSDGKLSRFSKFIERSSTEAQDLSAEDEAAPSEGGGGPRGRKSKTARASSKGSKKAAAEEETMDEEAEDEAADWDEDEDEDEE